MDLLERVAASFRAGIDPATGHVLIHGADDETWEPPVRLVVTEAELRAHLERMADDAVEVFPDVEPLQAAYQLFDVHLCETLATKVLPGSELRLDHGGLRSVPEREVSFDVPDDAGPLMWVSPEQFTRMMRDLRRTGRRARMTRRTMRRRQGLR